MISNDDGKKYKQLSEINPHYVFTFNYTNTYTRYGIEQDISHVNHIHGDLVTENIVLWYDDENPEDLLLIQFKKYFQRIQYQLRSINKSMFYGLGENAGDEEVKDTVAHVYGMSLDITDEDIIKEIFELAKQMVVYYRVPEIGDMLDYEQKVINLIAILGKEEFIKALQSKRIIYLKKSVMIRSSEEHKKLIE